jgi:hypothetical protein
VALAVLGIGVYYLLAVRPEFTAVRAST